MNPMSKLVLKKLTGTFVKKERSVGSNNLPAFTINFRRKDFPWGSKDTNLSEAPNSTESITHLENAPEWDFLWDSAEDELP